MNIAELKGEKTVATLARRLLAESSKETPKTTQTEMEAALLRVNPQLNQIGDLPKGMAIIVPDRFVLAPAESIMPMQNLASQLLAEAETALAQMQATIKARAAEFSAQSEQVQTWLKGQQAKDLVKKSPRLKEVFATAATSAKTAPKEQTAAAATAVKALDGVKTALTKFRAQAIAQPSR